jgi:hypothetical protein
MPFLKNLSKSVGKAAEQAKFEADKLVKVNRLSGELSGLTGGMDKIIASIGNKVIELKAAGQIQLPAEVDDLIGQLDGLKGQIAAKRAQVDAAKAEKFEDHDAVPSPAPMTAAPTAPAAAGQPAGDAGGTPKFCPNCGAGLEAGTRFCGTCGQKIG